MKEHVDCNETLNTLSSLEDIIFSISGKSDFEELEAEYFNTVSHLIPAHATALYLLKPGQTNPKRIGARGVDRDFLLYYEKEGRAVDPLRRWITQQRTPNQSQILLGLKGWQRHPVYTIVGEASIDFAMQSPIVLGQDLIGTLNFGRDIREGPFTATDLKAVSIISKFLGLAIAKSIGCSDHPNFKKALCKSIDQVPHGIVIINAEYAIQYANPAARKLSARSSERPHGSNDLSSLIKQNTSLKGKYGLFNSRKVRAMFCPIPGSDHQQSIVFLEEEPPLTLPAPVSGMLTNREIDVLQLIDKGMSNKEIAGQLDISINTVKRHLDNIYGKLQVNSRTQLISKIYKLLNSHKT